MVTHGYYYFEIYMYSIFKYTLYYTEEIYILHYVQNYIYSRHQQPCIYLHILHTQIKTSTYFILHTPYSTLQKKKKTLHTPIKTGMYCITTYSILYPKLKKKSSYSNKNWYVQHALYSIFFLETYYLQPFWCKYYDYFGSMEKKY